MVWAYICVKYQSYPPPPPPPGQVCKYTRQRFVEVFHLSGQVKGLLLSWCARVCDGTGKIEVRIGGGLVF